MTKSDVLLALATAVGMVSAIGIELAMVRVPLSRLSASARRPASFVVVLVLGLTVMFVGSPSGGVANVVGALALAGGVQWLVFILIRSGILPSVDGTAKAAVRGHQTTGRARPLTMVVAGTTALVLSILGNYLVVGRITPLAVVGLVVAVLAGVLIAVGLLRR